MRVVVMHQRFCVCVRMCVYYGTERERERERERELETKFNIKEIILPTN